MNIFNKINRKVLIVAVLAGILSFGGSYALTNMRTQASQASDGVVQVALHENSAKPDSIAVTTGQTVMFNSADGKIHNLSLGEGGDEHDHHGPFYSGEFGADEAWRATFEQPGTYFFHDHTNPDINVLVVVYDDNSQ